MLNVKVGQRLDAYHDGKASPSRLSIVEIIDSISITDVSRRYLRMWKRALSKDFDESLFDRSVHYVNGPQRFWDWNCDQFIFGKIVGDGESEKDPMMFARMSDGKSWYAVNWNYQLDVSRSIRKKMLPTWEKAAKECGLSMKWNKTNLRFDYFDKSGKKVEA